MTLARYFVFRHAGRWLVSLDGRPIGRHLSRDEAISSAIVMADLMGSMRHEADVMVEGEGKIDLAWTYGIDPVPQRPAEVA